MTLDSELLDILVCPESKEPLIYFEDQDFLFCPESQLKYPIRDGIPQMLADEAKSVTDSECEDLLEEAEDKNLVWTAQGEETGEE